MSVLNPTAKQKPPEIIYPAGRKKDGSTAERGLYRFLRSRLLVDCLAAFSLSAGLLLTFFPLTVMDGGLGQTLGLAALSVLVLAALRIRWWLGPGLFLLASGAIVWRYWRLELLSARWRYWVSFAQWLWEGAPAHEVFTGSASLELLKYAIIFGVTLVVFLVLRRFFSLLLLLAAVAVAAVWADYVSMRLMLPLDLTAALSMCALGIVMLLPRVYARRIRRSTKNGDRRAAMQMVAVPGAVVVVLLAQFFTPAETWDWRSSRLSNFFYDLGYLFGGPFEVYNEGATNFGLAVLGYQPVTERLGGPAVLPDWHMLTVVAERPVLLRGAVMDSYTGSQWTVGSADGDFRYEGVFWRSYRADAFDLGMPLGGEGAAELYESLTDPVSLQITYETEYYTTLFTAGQVQDIAFSNPLLYSETFFNQRSELYLTRPVPLKETVTMQTRVFHPEAPGFEEGFANLESLASAAQDERYQAIAERYTGLPASLPQSVRDAAVEAAGAAATPYEAAVAIARWLGEGFRYTLNPAMPPPDSDFVANFLETGEGYCTYFASSMAVMARCMDLPSRYVTGFARERDHSRENTYLATGKTAHAWAEIYFSGIGWVAFDPLQWNADEPLNRAQEQGDLSAIDPGYYEEEEELDDLDYIPGAVIVDGAGDVNLWIHGLAALGVLIVGLLAYLAYVWSIKYRRYELAWVMKKLPDTAGRFGYYFSDIMRQLSLLGCPIQPGETLARYPDRVAARIPADGARLGEVAAVQMRLHFAEKEPTQAELEEAARFHRQLEDTLREKLSAAMYLWKRAARK